jgi:hypothetical protein
VSHDHTATSLKHFLARDHPVLLALRQIERTYKQHASAKQFLA